MEIREFKLGKVVVTKRIDNRMKEDPKFERFVQLSLGRYARHDWGDTDKEDKQANDDAVKNDERILAAYIFRPGKEKIWIITEWDRSVTTILFPDEY